jgi:hypothetical protein
MFKKIADLVKAKIAYNKASNHPIYSRVMKASQKAIIDLGLDKLVQRGSPGMVSRANDLHNLICLVLDSKNSTITLREFFINNLIQLGKTIVLLPKAKQTEMKGQYGITGELNKHLVKISKLDKYIQEELHGINGVPDPITEEYLKGWVSSKYILLFWYYVSINELRFAIGDHNLNIKKDWGLPCLHAVCVFEEYLFRKTIGLKPNVDATAAASYATFYTNFVMNGEKYPDLAFRDAYANQIKDKSIILPKF